MKHTEVEVLYMMQTMRSELDQTIDVIESICEVVFDELPDFLSKIELI